jgi:hypothetical protein
MVLFNQFIYFATYDPADPSVADCSNGTSFVHQTSFLASSSPNDSTSGPQLDTILSSFNAVTAGVAAVQDPDCSQIADDLLGDAVLGYGHQVSISQINTGQFKLVYHTGNLKQSTDTSGASVGVGETILTPPATISTVESWASILE